MDAWEVIDAGDLGYCEVFDFKCASKRTCEAWISGGPITEDSEMAKEGSEDDMSEGE
jgi:16S rRNA U516 pseudouridylate synthase RsuA-like enzyme